METISKINCINVGYFHKPHGVFGTLQLNINPEYAVMVEQSTTFMVEIEGLLVPWFAMEDGVRINSAKIALVDLNWVDDEKAARKLCGKKVYVEKSKHHKIISVVPANTLTDYTVADVKVGEIGKIIEVNDYAGNVVLTVKTITGQEIMVPLHEELVAAWDEAKKLITLDLPDGLLNIQQ